MKFGGVGLDIWFIASRTLLLLCVLFLLIYDIKIIKNISLPKARFISLGTTFLLLGSILFIGSDFLVVSHMEKLSVSLMAIGVIMYVYRLIRLTIKFNHLANTDTLTGLVNRRCLFTKLNNEQILTNQTSIIFVDIDDFKAINDKMGHQAADKILCSLINEMQKNLRSTDILSRYGGDEFVIILPNTNKETALLILERLQESVYNIKYENGIRVSFSAGVATSPEDGNSLEELIYVADKEMYMKKTKSSLKTIS